MSVLELQIHICQCNPVVTLHTQPGVKRILMSSVCTQMECSLEGPCVTVQGHPVHLLCQVRFSQLKLAL